MDEKLIQFTLPSPGPETPVAVPRKPVVDAPTKARILVAEDDPVSRQLISARLSKWGYNAVITHNGAEAMSVLREPNPPILAILDWTMPDMDGLEVCSRVREAEKLVYIIMLTARGDKENIIEGLRAGADDYLIKPFHAEELQARILVGLRIMTAQDALARRVLALEAAASDTATVTFQIPL